MRTYIGNHTSKHMWRVLFKRDGASCYCVGHPSPRWHLALQCQPPQGRWVSLLFPISDAEYRWHPRQLSLQHWVWSLALRIDLRVCELRSDGKGWKGMLMWTNGKVEEERATTTTGLHNNVSISEFLFLFLMNGFALNCNMFPYSNQSYPMLYYPILYYLILSPVLCWRQYEPGST